MTQPHNCDTAKFVRTPLPLRVSKVANSSLDFLDDGFWSLGESTAELLSARFNADGDSTVTAAANAWNISITESPTEPIEQPTSADIPDGGLVIHPAKSISQRYRPLIFKHIAPKRIDSFGCSSPQMGTTKTPTPIPRYSCG